MSEHWTADQMPRLDGKVAVVTGANTGIGFQTAQRLASAGAHVVLACRSEPRARAAMAELEQAVPAAKVAFASLDLGDLESVERCAESLCEQHAAIDILVNNAGVMVPPRGLSKSGFELQFGVNHIGHFAFTGRLLPKLEAAESGRIVSVSSVAHRGAKIDFDNLRLEKKYSPWREYKQSKLANLLFVTELDRRLRVARRATKIVGAHPGVTFTELQRHTPAFLAKMSRLVLMPTWKGALPSLYAATEGVPGGTYYGPRGLEEMWGWPAPAKIDAAAQDPVVGKRLFDYSAEVTGVSFDTLADAA